MLSNTALDEIVGTHNAQVELCDLLEQIADTLPHEVNPNCCDSAVELLVRHVPLHRQDQEETLFPLLRQRALPEDNIEELLKQLCTEHIIDECSAIELLEILPELAVGRSANDANVYGYMLRSFFECFRRHLAWEQHLILPLARSRMTPEDLIQISVQMRLHRAALSEKAAN